MARDDDETVEAKFRALTAEWELTAMEAALLLGVDGRALGLDLVPRAPDSEIRERMRLLATLRDRLPDVFRSSREVNGWLRTFDAHDVSPVVFMSHGRDQIQAMVEAVEAHATRAAGR